MDYDYQKRDYQLPKGCKDLMDVLKLKNQPMPQPLQNIATPLPLPPIIGEIMITEPMTVYDLATALKQKPFQIIADVMAFGVFVNVHQQIQFEIISGIARKYGFIVKNAA
jgi:hypothetical protein